MREDLEQLVVAYVESLNTGDVDRLRSLLDPDVRYTGFGADARESGLEAILATVQYVMGTDPGTRTTITHMVLDAEANEAVVFLVAQRSDANLPTMEITTLISVGADALITSLSELHRVGNLYKDPGCFDWRLNPVPPL